MAKLHFYYSAMNAGKSTVLLQSDYNYRERGMNTLLFTPAIDTRYGVGKIYSRLGLVAEAIAFDDEFNLFEYTLAQMNIADNNIQCVLVDEAQFLTKAQVLQLTDIVDSIDIPVLAYGLRSDFLGEPFEGSRYLLAWAEKISEIKTICHCGKKATMNMRIDEQGRPIKTGAQVVIGGNESYVATCRQHYKHGAAAPIKEKHKKLDDVKITC